MAVNLSPVGGVAGQFFDNNGNPLTGGKIFTYSSGTTTNQATYISSAGVTAHTNPIILDAAGRVPSGEIWLTDGLQYKFVIKTANDVLIGTYDNIIGINSNFVNFLTEIEVQTATAGQTVFTLTTMQYQPGTNNLTVYVDGVNQIDGSTYSYIETNATTVTFTAGLHVGALVKFTTAQTLSTGVTDASLVTYTPPFTASVSTTVEDKLAQTVSVKDFGAVGDGVTNDTAAIQDAIDYVSTLGGAVYFPAGTYKTSSTLTISSPNVTLYGDNKDASIILANADSFNVITIGTGANYTEIRNLCVKGGATTDTSTQYSILCATSSTPTEVTIDNCRLTNANSGISVGSGTYWSVTNNQFDTLIGKTSGRGYGVLSPENSQFGIISGNHFVGTINNGRHAVYLSVGCSNTLVSNNIVNSFNESAFAISSTSAQPGCFQNVVTGNIIRNGGTVATVESSGIVIDGNCGYNTVSNNSILNFQNSGIIANDAGMGGLCINNVISGNTIINAYLTGIDIIGAKYTSVTNNYVYNASVSSAGTYRGIRIVSSGSFGTEVCDNTKVVGNVSSGAGQASALQINTSAPVPTNTYIAGNNFQSGATAGLAVELNLSSVPTTTYIWNGSDATYTASGTDSIVNYASRVVSINFGTVAANATEEFAVTIVGVDTATNWTVVVSPDGAAIAGLIWCGWVSATNTVTIRVANVTTSTIDAGTLNWRATCFKHNV